MKGTVIEPRVGNSETPEEQKKFLKPHSYWIMGDDKKRYFAHAGDLEPNENMVLKGVGDLSHLKNDDRVEFEPALEGNKAMHVRKLKR